MTDYDAADGRPDHGIDEKQAYALAEAYQNGVNQGRADERRAHSVMLPHVRTEAAVDAIYAAADAIRAAQASVGEVNFCRDCAEWAVKVIESTVAR